MNFSLRSKIKVAAFGCAWLFVVMARGERGLPPDEGITNFGKVSNSLYRGAQPDETGVKNLRAIGVKTIINLRTAKGALKEEKTQAADNGILYTNIPLAGFGRPTDEEVNKILAVIASSPGPVFVHCEHGCDRTGTIIACYRIQHDDWCAADAIREAKKYGISPLERGMRGYIAHFAKVNYQKK